MANEMLCQTKENNMKAKTKSTVVVVSDALSTDTEFFVLFAICVVISTVIAFAV